MARQKIQKLDPQSFIAEVGAGRSHAMYQRDQPIFRQGDAADAVFYIRGGKVQITVVSEEGKERVVAMLESEAFFGEGCLTGQPLHLATASAMTDCAIVRIEKDTMIRELRDDPMFSQMFMAFLLSHNVQLEADLVDQLFNSSEKRLARVLMLLANFGKDGKMETVIPQINQEVWRQGWAQRGRGSTSS
jgi:CRP/FNR family transcriptional regulator, cyclic AMP receptor protein